MKKEITEKELYLKLAAYCAKAERCVSDLEQKMNNYNVSFEVSNRVLELLKKENYLSESRYASAVASDKFRFNGWGKKKIQQFLYHKGINSNLIDKSLSEIDDDEYLNKLTNLILQKRKSVKAQDDYELKNKLIRFALSRGFEMDLILRII